MIPPNPVTFDPAVLHELDVRDVLRRGGHPLDQILAAADSLPHGHVLHLRAPFEPVPLFQVMTARDFDHHSTMFESDDWSIWFWRRDAPPGARDAAPIPPRSAVGPDTLDLRAMIPPEPMLRVLEAIDRGSPPFHAALPLFPLPLAPILEGLGWTAVIESELPDGGVIVRFAAVGA